MAEYDYTIICRPGVQHRNADALSRRPCDGKGCLCTSLQSKEQVSVSSQTDELIGKISVLRESSEGYPEVTEELEGRLWDVAEMKAAQVEDNSIGPVYKFVEGQEPRPSWEQVSHFSRESKTLLTGWDRLRIEDGLLYYHRKGESSSGASPQCLEVLVRDQPKRVLLLQLPQWWLCWRTRWSTQLPSVGFIGPLVCRPARSHRR